MVIETMTPQEATELLRSYGMKISKDTLCLGLQQAKYPFGICINGKVAPVYQIFTKQLLQWIEERGT